ncbi:MAG: TrkH family potassium uptake protein [Bacillota bacterium]|nr:TrkH family potassium uptake protein [Bacillota bacterium]
MKLDFQVIIYYTARILMGLAALMVIPLITALFFQEWNIALDFLIGIFLSLITAYTLTLITSSEAYKSKLSWVDGLVAVTVAWLLGMILAAVPYYLSGFYGSFLDATFDVMSGLTTTGLVLIQDLDHVPYGINMWRHLLSFLGGQGMVVLALTFLFRDISGAFKLYVGEAKDEQLLPNAKNTARVIWFISIIYLLIGTFIFWVAGLYIGLSPLRSFFHGLWVFMAAWSTGGFAPQSQNILYYHSTLYELVTVLFFTVGSFNFALHYTIWRANRREIFRNLEVISFFITVNLLFSFTAGGLAQSDVYTSFWDIFRKGYYHLISGHTTTGFMTVYASQFQGWSDLALLGLIISMLFGASACSTAGGFKALRIGIIWHTLIREVKRVINPERAVVTEKFHHLRDVILEERHMRSALLVVILYITTFTITTVASVASGYPLIHSMFEAASATGNVGLSIGVVAPSMPGLLKVLYILVMWVGRLEFMAVLAGVAFIIETLRRK